MKCWCCTKCPAGVLCWQGITFGDFKEFCQFLNNLDDFTLAMRIYTYANQPISEGELSSAVLSAIYCLLYTV